MRSAGSAEAVVSRIDQAFAGLRLRGERALIPYFVAGDPSLETTARLRPDIPADRVVVSESGISRRDDIVLLKNMKVDAALIGEELVKAADPAAKLKELLGTT